MSTKIHPKYKSQHDEWDSGSDAGSMIGDEKASDLDNFPAARSLAEQRRDLRQRIVSEVMQEILPDIGQYDIDGVPTATEKKPLPPFVKTIIAGLKFFGLWDLTLHEIIIVGNINMFKRKLKKLAKVSESQQNIINSYDERGRTPLSLAVKLNQLEFVDLLLENKALPDIVDSATGRSPLMYAISVGSQEIVKLLLKYGASASLCDFKCVTPLMLAAWRDDILTCKLLCSDYLDIAAQDENGWTALHYAAYGDSPRCCLLLLAEGAPRHLKDYNGRKALHIARFKQHGNTIAVLEDAKSRMDAATGDDFFV